MRALTALLTLLLVIGCPHPGGVRSGDRRSLADAMVGDWVDETGARYRIVRLHADEPVVTYVVDAVGEPLDLVRQGFEDGRFAFTYRVPTTGFEVTLTVTGVEEGLVRVHWRNDRGQEGSDTLRPH
ncbi:MAG: hypothetical protein H6732_06055 [Alphaproteobacteria bacterium]|nr:hypothetical protein [Alphaproteobacteria bacterium]